MKIPNNPRAVLISDLHFTLATLELASAALISAVQKAKELHIPLIIAGDTLDGKALLRGEVVNRLLDLFEQHITPKSTYLMVGNHDLLNEKGADHALRFLDDYCWIVSEPMQTIVDDLVLIPYQNDITRLQAILDKTEKNSTLIMHQGVQTAYMGHYVQDKTSLSKSTFADFRVISGHYHRAQNIKCGRTRPGAVGLFSYIGNPYTLTFGEASDGPKGYQILGEDGLLTQVPLNLRKHVIIETAVAEFEKLTRQENAEKDIFWVKLHGTESDLEKLSKKTIGDRLFGHMNFKFDTFPTSSLEKTIVQPNQRAAEVLETMIKNMSCSDEDKTALSSMWKVLVS